MAHTKHVNRVADAIEAGELVKRGIGFNMASYAKEGLLKDQIDSCDTTACIAGWAYAVRYRGTTATRLLEIQRRDLADEGYFFTIEKQARAFLGLTDDEAIDLFRGDDELNRLSKIKPEQAVRVLRHLAKTGEVDWLKAGRP